ncbi:MAG: methionine synthase, partial [Spirochaetes bacterium]|nr:methionine synthase [Spirochaetota bacterium]
MYIAQQVKRRGENLTRMRFSAGYGDFMLENQKHFFELLGLEKLGVSLTERYIFIPEKTVTAIAGVEGA